MVDRLRALAAVLLCSVGVASAADRLAVLEFFGRPQGGFCSAAGPAMISLQDELQGEAVILEYDFDQTPSQRLDRFWATGTAAQYLPIVMVGSGYRTSSGQVDYQRVYSDMIEDELARSPRAEITAYWRRVGNRMRTYVAVYNTGSTALEVDEQTSVWVIVYEKAPIGVSNTWVRSLVEWPLEDDLDPGEVVTAVINVSGSSVVDWNRVAGLALLEDRPGNRGSYDMLQAAETFPVGLQVTPEDALLTAASPTAELVLQGPHVLEWTATSGVPWLEVEPVSGTLPGTVTVTLKPELRPPTETSTTVSIEATGDSMAFQAQVDVTAGGAVSIRRATGRRRLY
jgi:hypothetical protein